VAKSAPIAPLTGIRLIAAAWVVLFHIYLYNGDDLAARHPLIDGVVGPVVSQGDLGVDLFFLLSGFVLAHNYLGRVGERPSVENALGFYWLRLARVWPLYMVAVLVGGLLLWVRLSLWGVEPNVPLSRDQFLAQMFMVQQWGAANVPNTSWTGPAWSISAEWLAYLCFPALAVAVWRLRGRAGRVTVIALGAVLLLPTLVWTAAAHTQAAPYMWLARLASEFTCGMLLSAGLSRATPRLRTACTWLAPATLTVGAGWLYVAAWQGRPWLGPLVVALFPVLVVALVHGDGRLHRFLGSRVMVLGGGISFALYLVHVPLLKLFREALEHHALPLGQRHQLEGELLVACVSVLFAYLLFRFVEEPARMRLRALAPQVIGAGIFVAAWLQSGRTGRVRISPSSRMVTVELTGEHGIQQHVRQSS
jgi:peptidoglycan/LPS O-acetylase OafA/YrhL